jgi:hypothetical protein
MNEADADFELRRLFLGFGGAIALLIVLYASRALKLYVFGRRVRARVAKVVKKEADPALPRRGPTYSYVLEYADPRGERHAVHERQELAFQEFQVGDEVTACLQNDRVAEILSWRRLSLSGLVIVLTVAAMIAGYYVLLVHKKG